MDYLEIRELYHHGIKGQKWGIRRFQNEDGSLTAEGKARYQVNDYTGKMSKEGKKLYKADVKATRREIAGDYSDTYDKNYDRIMKEKYGNKHWTNLNKKERNVIDILAEDETRKTLIKKYGDKSINDFDEHDRKVKTGIKVTGGVLATVGTVAVAALMYKKVEKELGEAAVTGVLAGLVEGLKN